MERIHQMHVVPDLVPSLHPSLDLRVNFPEAPPENIYRRTRVKRRYEKAEPGAFLLPEQVCTLGGGVIFLKENSLLVLDSETTSTIHDSIPHRTTFIHLGHG